MNSLRESVVDNICTMLNTRLLTVFRKYFLLIFLLLLVPPLALFLHTLSLDPKIIVPANSLVDIKPSNIENPAVTDEPTGGGLDTRSSSVVGWTNDKFNDSCMTQRKLIGVNPVHLEAPSFDKISQALPDLQEGGYYVPNCRHTDKVAIIVPFRDREDHLRLFLHNLHPLLQRQLIEYQIFVIEQAGNDSFNRAMLFNVGFSEGLKTRRFTCFIFHDVDLIPEHDHNLYECPTSEEPRHMSLAVDTLNYKLKYDTLFGGVSAMTTDQFRLVNGFSNRFWGWGGEDDDMSNRLAFHDLSISRYSPTVARYKMLKHSTEPPNEKRYEMLAEGEYLYDTDGLSNLNYTVEQLSTNRLFTQIKVRLGNVFFGVMLPKMEPTNLKIF